MKKLTFLLVLLSGAVLVSCTKEPVEVLSSNVTADYEAEALTKAVSPDASRSKQDSSSLGWPRKFKRVL